MGERREKKKRETRERISDVATGLFIARGFDAVTFDEIAAAADVSRMTVFNYFPRKEDLMLDREEDLNLAFFRDAIAARPKGQSPVSAVRRCVAELRTGKHPFTQFDRRMVDWWRLIDASASLQSRLREHGEAAAEGLAIALGGTKPDGLSRLMGAMIVLTVHTARREAVRMLAHGSSVKKASEAFFALMDRGLTAVEAMAGDDAGSSRSTRS